MMKLLVFVQVLAWCVSPVWADNQAGENAYKRGDYVTALREWRVLAEQGDADGQANLGGMYESGTGIPKDSAQARRWFEKAGFQGHSVSQFYLGMLYGLGEGGPQDFVQAHLWLTLSAVNGNKQAAEFRDGIERKMTSAQIAESKKLVREWKAKAP